MKSRIHGKGILAQSDREYAENYWQIYNAVLSVNHQGPINALLTNPEFYYLHRPVKDEDTPTQEDIQAWVNFGLEALNSGKNLLINCEAGQNRSVIVSSLIEAMFYKRNWWGMLDVYHEEMLKEDPPANWWPYEHWEKAISEWIMKLVVRPPANPIVPAPFSPISMEEAIEMSGGTRPDFLGSLYKYTKMLPMPALVVELGTCRAESTISIAAALKGTGGHLISIDPVFRTGEVWILDAHIRGAGHVDSNIQYVLNKFTALGLDGIVSIIPDYSWEALKRWDGRMISALFCDAEHTYEAVLRDCDWMQFIQPNGYAWFDDWISPVEAAVMEYVSVHPEWKLLHKSTDSPTNEYCVTIFQRLV